MQDCYMTTTEKGSLLEVILFCFFGFKQLFKKRIIKGNDLLIIFIPLPKSLGEKLQTIYFKKLCKLFHKMHIRNICAYNIKNPVLAYKLRTEFYILKGISVFHDAFYDILERFSKKIGYPLKECELVLISNYPREAKQYILKIIKQIKSIVIYTTKPDKFTNMIEEIKKQYGIYITLKSKEDYAKKYKKIYVNIEPTPIFKESFFQSVHMIDSYKFYKGAFCDVIFSYNTPEDHIIKENKIIKNLCFTEYYTKTHNNHENKGNTSKILKNDHYKIVNIVK
ncbi:MAG: hypothetical protein E7403_01695 [Ruminococcaceae bacterium]|nr:hypothetical protein [Oscillospiraceae bacterium]